MAVSLAPEKLFEIGGYDVTNATLTGFFILILLVLFFAIYTSRIKIKPRSKLQLLAESLVISLENLAQGIMGDKATKAFFPLIFTFFIFIITSNWFGLLPFVGSIGLTDYAHKGDKTVPIFVIGKTGSYGDETHLEKPKTESENIDLTSNETSTQDEQTIDEAEASLEVQSTTQPEVKDSHKEEASSEKESHAEETSFGFTREEVIHKPFFRSPSADLNFTIALAIISFCLIQYAALKAIKLEHLQKFFDYRVSIPKGWKIILLPFMFILNILWKTLELVLEISKIISFSFRLFGNIFAGEVLLFVMTTLTFGIATLPFLGLELFVGFIQALVFCLLTMVFIKVSSESHHGHTEKEVTA